jgi:hypothetical protein
MRDYINLEAFQQTMTSYQTAIEAMFGICKNALPASNQWNDGLPTEWQVAWSGKSQKELMPHITDVTISRSELMDFGHPKRYINNLLHVYAYATFSYQRASVSAPVAACNEYVDEDGEFHPAHDYKPATIELQKANIRLLLFDRTWTVAQWRKSPDDIRQFMDNAPEAIQQKYQSAIEKVEADIAAYNQAIQKVTTI